VGLFDGVCKVIYEYLLREHFYVLELPGEDRYLSMDVFVYKALEVKEEKGGYPAPLTLT
jgi:hypothetical protein